MEFGSRNVLHQLVRVFSRPFSERVGLSFYSVPNFILAFIPAEINANTLNTMTAFAVRRHSFASESPQPF